MPCPGTEDLGVCTPATSYFRRLVSSMLGISDNQCLRHVIREANFTWLSPPYVFPEPLARLGFGATPGRVEFLVRDVVMCYPAPE